MGRMSAPSPWVGRWVPVAETGGRALDLACGTGRHVALLLERGYTVTAVDADVARLGGLVAEPRVERWEVDLEDGSPFPLAERRFDVLVVTNYLHRPLLPTLVRMVASGGRLVYETFSDDQPRFGRPTEPAYLLRPGELLDAVRGGLRVRGYEDCAVEDPPRAVQRICAEREHQEVRHDP